MRCKLIFVLLLALGCRSKSLVSESKPTVETGEVGLESPDKKYLVIRELATPENAGQVLKFRVIRQSDKVVIYQSGCPRLQLEWQDAEHLAVICPPGKPVTDQQLRKDFTRYLDFSKDLIP